MEFTPKIKTLEDKFDEAYSKIRRNCISWRPAYKIDENLDSAKELLKSLVRIKKEIEKQSI